MQHAFDAVVVGAGQAGLATSRALRERGVQHVVLERDEIGATWRRQRWRSFRLNGPASFSALPGLSVPGDSGAFGTAGDFVRYLETYRDTFELPVRTGVHITTTQRSADGGFLLRAADGATFSTRHVVLATGGLNVGRVPAMAAGLSSRITQLHSTDYADAAGLPPGAVLVVGGAQTGCQIAEDLLDAGRQVFMATSRVPRAPRRYRGRDIFDWLHDARFFEQRIADLPDPSAAALPQPQITGAAGARTTSYQHLARAGVRLFGRLESVEGTTARFAGDLHEHVRFADETSRRIRTVVDEYIAGSGAHAAASEDDPAEFDAGTLLEPAAPAEVDLAAHGVSTVIWCTGLTGDFRWLPPEALDARGQPRHVDGIGAIPRTYVVGLPWLSRRGSGIIPYVGADAERVADAIAR